MPEYKPPSRVMALAAKVRGVPIAHAIRPDGSIVIVFEDGRKLCFVLGSMESTPTLSTPSSGSAPTLSTPTRAGKRK